MEQHDKIDATIGDNGKNIVTGKDINQDAREQNVTVQNVFPQPWHPAQPHGQGEGLSVSAEQRLDTEIRKLRDDVTSLNGNVVALTYQLKNETESRQMRTETQERIVNTLADTIKAEVMSVLTRLSQLEIRATQMERKRGERDPIVIVFAGAITVILIVIAWVLISRGGL